MKKELIVGIVIGVVLCGVFAAIYFYWQNLRGIGPVFKDTDQDISDAVVGDSSPFLMPEGFSISIVVKDLPGVRVLAFDVLGNLWVSRTKEGVISLIEFDENGAVSHQGDVFRNLQNPHGLVFDPDDPQMLYFAEENSISRVRVYSEGVIEKVTDLPSGGGHYTRTIRFGPDGRLYVSIGSSCNVCIESDARRAAIYSMNKDGSDFREYARGLRNAVFFDWGPDGRMWATEMGRDRLGDDIPPDEINIVVEGGNYGWPTCYGKNIHDTDFDKNIYIRNPCLEPFELPSYIDLQAHSAPLGFTFIPQGDGWPQIYWGDMIVAFHGSWNRSVPTGYKLVRIPLDVFGNLEDSIEDFVSGWLTQDNESFGRPVDVVFSPSGELYISDDKAGVVYTITYTGVE